MERKEPTVIQYGGFAPRYYCGKCHRRIYKRHKICPHCFCKEGKMIQIAWEVTKK